MHNDWTSFLNSCVAWNLEPTQTQVEQLDCYYRLLVEKNKVMNLTAVTEFEQAKTWHFLDSLALPALTGTDGGASLRLIDVGTGAGFPGMVLKILFPAWQITLLDAQRKRTDFLKEVADALNLTDLEIVHGRAEAFAKDDDAYREAFDIACARAVSSLRVLSEYLLPFVKPGGFACAYKTQDNGEEQREAEGAITKLGGGALSVTDYCLPQTDVGRRLIRIEKVQPTPLAYPRREGIPEKRPL